jgi:hypothetical protein
LTADQRCAFITRMSGLASYYSLRRGVTLTLAVAGLLATVRAASSAEGIRELLAAVAANATAPTPVCADVRIETPEKGSARLCARDDAVYVEVEGGVRALIRPGTILMADDSTATPAPPATVLAGDLLLEDMTPFTTASLAYPQVSDEGGPSGTVVTSAPAGKSIYALLVLTIDPERAALVGTKYYEGSVSDLVKFRTDELVEVGGRPRPSAITVERVAPPRTTRLRLKWREAPDVPAALFTPEGLAKPSQLASPAS